MKKLLFSVIAIVGFAIISKAQYERPAGSELSIGVSPILPVGDLHNAYGFGLGGDLKYAYNFNESVAVTLSAGYTEFFGKTTNIAGLGDVKVSNSGLVPIKAGIRFSMSNFYAEPQLGVSVSTDSDGGSAFTYAGQIGVMASPNFDIGLRYEGWSKNSANNGFIGLRLAYTFPLK